MMNRKPLTNKKKKGKALKFIDEVEKLKKKIGDKDFECALFHNPLMVLNPRAIIKMVLWFWHEPFKH